ncbi:hypothetical protein M406DRAFT_322358 [Cryphonectria parasitica EP155]|uniref:Uncharacterized protein n=1 Tax=Cryphonectria parasitica (strain ATCC 38755 / EP155) TaxID=660469 RepID=A0A9P5CPE3_CRYP1|nr:uncharacterized protein M406DRAFT_322358 [Cryphonectria parasitica EP155]KAF3766384.1 hypothetical protein M406DRAFT_322358 [Cryphonectria parasitica EP155]
MYPYAIINANPNAAIVDTFLKLSPDDILRFAINRFAYSRDRIVREVRLAYPNILFDRQSLGHAIQAVVGERCLAAGDEPENLLFNVYCGVYESSGGILDYEEDDETVRENMDKVDRRQKAAGWVLEDRHARLPSRWHAQTQRGRLEP